MYGLSLIHAVEPSNPKMVGPPGFEPGSDGPQPPSIGQANPRTRGPEQGSDQISRVVLKGATSSINSTWETNIRRQQ